MADAASTCTDGKGGKDTITGLAGKGRYLRMLCLKPGQFGLSSIWEIEFPDAEAAEALAEAERQAAEARREAEAEAASDWPRRLAEHGVEEIVFALRQPGKDGHWYANFSYYADDENRLTLRRRRQALPAEPAHRRGDRAARRPERRRPRSGRSTTTPRRSCSPTARRRPSTITSTRSTSTASGLRQLTDGPYDDIEPTLPARRRHRVRLQPLQALGQLLADPGGRAAPLRRRRQRTSAPISANLEHDNTPWVLPDGRILYQRWEYVDRSQVDYHHLWTTNPDGTGQMVYYGNMHPGTVMIDAKPIPDTKKVVAIFSPGHGRREHDGVDHRGRSRERARRPGARPRRSRRTPASATPGPSPKTRFLAAQGDEIVLLDGQGRDADDLSRCRRGRDGRACSATSRGR